MNNIIGVESGLSTAAANTYATSGNGAGIFVDAAATSMIIGTDLDGSDDASEYNVIANQAGNGIQIGNGATVVTIAGNYIGLVSADSGSTWTTAADLTDPDGGGSTTASGIVIDSTALTSLTIGGSNAAQRNLITGSPDYGIQIADVGSAIDFTIENTYIGVGSNGTSANGNTDGGILISDGGAITLTDLVVSNTTAGIGILVNAGTSLTMTGVYMGTTSAGTTVAINTKHCLEIDASTMADVNIGSSSTTNVCAGATDSVSSDKEGWGIYVKNVASAITPVDILGTYIGIGTDGLTTTSMGNNSGGLFMLEGALTLGGTNSLGTGGTGLLAAGNVISNNGGIGVFSNNAGDTTIQGNLIGVKRTGAGAAYNAAAGNTDENITIDSGNMANLTIGGPALGQRNIISNSQSASGINSGLLIEQFGNSTGAIAKIQNNYIGVGWDGSTDLGNNDHGISLEDNSGAVYHIGSDLDGTNDSAEGNVISGNGNTSSGPSGAGIDIGGTFAGTVHIMGNTIGLTANGTAFSSANSSNIEGGIFMDTSGAVTVNIGSVNSADSRNYLSGNGGSGSGSEASGIVLNATNEDSDIKVYNNYIGLASDGETAVANTESGINIKSGFTGSLTIGASGTYGRNVISGNDNVDGSGVGIQWEATAAGSFVEINNNYIGLNAAGTRAVTNTDAGVDVAGSAGGTVMIGSGSSTGDRNVISGNTGAGVLVEAGSNNTTYISGNYIGLSADGESILANGLFALSEEDPATDILNNGGIFITEGTATVNIGTGGYLNGESVATNTCDVTNEATRNVISGNIGHGIGYTGGGTVTICGNYIGTDKHGDTDLGNTNGADTVDAVNGSGIVFYDLGGAAITNPTIGGTSASARNVISGNSGSGIALVHSPAVGAEFTAGSGQTWTSGIIKSNYIGVSADGRSALENSDYGIYVDSNGSTFTNLSIGSSDDKNTINNTNHTGLLVDDVTLGNLSTVGTDNIWFDSELSGSNRYFIHNVSSVASTTLPNTACEDGIDNDGDGKIDLADDGCSGSLDLTETNTTSGGGGGGSSSSSTSTTTTTTTTTTETVTETAPVEVVETTETVTETAPVEEVVEEVVEEEVVEEVVESVPQTIAEVNVTDRAEAERDAIVNAISTTVEAVVDTAVEVVTIEPETESLLVTESVLEAIAAFDAEDALSEEAIDAEELDNEVEIIEAPVEVLEISDRDLRTIDRVLTEESTSKIQVARAERIIEEKVQESLEIAVEKIVENVIADAVSESAATIDQDIESLAEQVEEAKQTKVEVRVGGRTKKINKDTKIVFSVSKKGADELRAEAEEDKLAFLAEGGVFEEGAAEDVIIIDTSTDLDQNGIADIKQIQDGVPLFVEDPDNDGISARDELFFGGDPIKADKFEDLVPKKPKITNFAKKGTKVGNNPMFWLASSKVGETVDLYVVDVNDPTEQMFVGSGVVDGGYKIAISADLSDGEYLVLTDTETDGLNTVAKIEVDADLGIETPVLDGSFNYPTPQGGKQVNIFPVAHAQAVDQFGNHFITGNAQPGQTVYVTWKSLVYNSVVIADADAGYFEVEIPEALENGDHEVIVYVVDEEKSWFSSVSSLFFSK
ncbi:hypothetical protein JKY72_04450 [Candidatus Gracilibacteria bacterium]|nr:hypothetical protein [Candidatus Gracilibacteria bacterium]